jgi:hypothetical protein
MRFIQIKKRRAQLKRSALTTGSRRFVQEKRRPSLGLSIFEVLEAFDAAQRDELLQMIAAEHQQIGMRTKALHLLEGFNEAS